MSSADTYQTHFADTAAAYDGLLGTPLGRRERAHGNLRTITDITIQRIIEPVADLAVADRVAYVLAHRTGQAHLVIAASNTYLVITCDTQLDNADTQLISQHPTQPRIISIATPSGITPMLTPLTISE